MPHSDAPLDDSCRKHQLAPPAPRVVIDTDAANETDDQVALASALLSPQHMALEALYAAPYSFAHRRSTLTFEPTELRHFVSPAVGMERGLEEIQRILPLCG